MQELLGLEIEELQNVLGGPSYRAAQVFEWMYARNEQDFQQMTNLSKQVRAELMEKFVISLPQAVHSEHSQDGTTKYALRVGEETIEAVYMPETKRDTLCISSQAGCSFGCKFCVTARMNLLRQLSPAEILGEILLLLKHHGREKRINIVFMGMGEPLHNYDNVMKAIRILSHPKGLAVSLQRITISTVGFIPALLRMKEESAIPNLAVSLNAPNNRLRDELMPINRIYPIEMLVKTLIDLPLKHRQRITFEYVLLKGVNDSLENARELLSETSSIRCKINLIPFNPDPHLPYTRPDEQTISRFAGILVSGGRTVAVRRSRGPDISAACGQLGSQLIDPSFVPYALLTKTR